MSEPELGYELGRTEARRLFGVDTDAGTVRELASSSRYYGRQHDRPRDARGYWLGAARELRAIADEREAAA